MLAITRDARHGDPTGTGPLRQQLRKAAKLRLQQLRAQMRLMVVEHDYLGLGGGDSSPMAYHAPETRLNAFHHWLVYSSMQQLGGDWPRAFIERAWAMGLSKARDERRSEPLAHSGAEHVELVKMELKGIADAIVQNVSRAASDVVMRRMRRQAGYRNIAQAFDKTVNQRLVALCNVSCVKAFNHGKLEVYRRDGVRLIGIIPEHLPAKYFPPMRGPVKDARPKKPPPLDEEEELAREEAEEAELAAVRSAQPEPGVPWLSIAAGSALAAGIIAAAAGGDKPPDEELEAEEAGEEEAEPPSTAERLAVLTGAVVAGAAGTRRPSTRYFSRERREPAEEEEPSRVGRSFEEQLEIATEPYNQLVNYQTAEDELVCPACDEYAADGPYELEDVIVPPGLHPNCRCELIAWTDPDPRIGEPEIVPYYPLHDAEVDYIQGEGGRFEGSRPGWGAGETPGPQTSGWGIGEPLRPAAAPYTPPAAPVLRPVSSAELRELREGSSKPTTWASPVLKEITPQLPKQSELLPLAETWGTPQLEEVSAFGITLPAIGREEFERDNVEIAPSTANKPENLQGMLNTWNEKVQRTPAEFKQEFLGGLAGNMRVNSFHNGKELELSGDLHDENGRFIGRYTRTIDFRNNQGVSDYLALGSVAQGKGIAKQLLAANVASYQRLGLDGVKVHANIDIGGYSWAKYGYVPSQDSWDELRDTLRGRSDSSGYEAESWDDLSSDQQDQVFHHWAEWTSDDFARFEAESWREQGGDLEEAKRELADSWTGDSDKQPWLWEGLKSYAITVGEGDDVAAHSLGPFLFERGNSVQEVAKYTRFKYEARRGDGEEDPTVTVEWDKVDEHGKIEEDHREQIEETIVEVFNKKAEDYRSDIETPDWLMDNIAEQQSEQWNEKRERDRFRLAREHGWLPEPEPREESRGPDIDEFLDDDDPKAIWDIADHPQGKDLLLNTDWYGFLDFSDKQSMDRFNAYVAKKKK